MENLITKLKKLSCDIKFDFASEDHLNAIEKIDKADCMNTFFQLETAIALLESIKSNEAVLNNYSE